MDIGIESLYYKFSPLLPKLCLGRYQARMHHSMPVFQRHQLFERRLLLLFPSILSFIFYIFSPLLPKLCLGRYQARRHHSMPVFQRHQLFERRLLLLFPSIPSLIFYISFLILSYCDIFCWMFEE
jgi:arginyl-tRNA--protein-N-Asp/Glu arginylyltransferase